MPRQLNCRRIYKIVKWSDKCFPRKTNAYFNKIWIMSLCTDCAIGPRYIWREISSEILPISFPIISSQIAILFQMHLLSYFTKAALVLNYNGVIMGAVASQITSLMIVYSTVYSGAYQRRHQISASLAFVRGIHRWPVNPPHKWPVTRKIFPFDYVSMY